MRCKLCAAEASAFAQATVLGKYDVQYFRCSQCGFIQTEAPFWLDEAYASAITGSDLGLAQRNVALARRTQAVLLAFFDVNQRFLDYGGGYGLFVRLMRDAGFNFFLYDPHCANLFANGFAVETLAQERFEVITAFEVFEHLVQPRDEVEQLLARTDSLLFSTELVRNPPPPLTEWWYYGLEHGQHIALFTHQSLRYLARALNLNLYTDGRTLHLLTRRTLSPTLFRHTRYPLAQWLLRRLLWRRLRHRSLLAQDYYQVTGQRLA